MAVSSFLLLFLVIGCPPLARSCSCPEGSDDLTFSEALSREYCSTYNPNVYTAMVIGATCNCIPDPSDTASSSISCQRYEQIDQTSVNSSILAQGECAFERYERLYLGEGGCPMLGTRLTGSGVSIMEGGEPLDAEVANLTVEQYCNYSCPFNLRASNDENYYSRQPCLYTIRVSETFKGNYSAGDVIEVSGPDVLTSCGAYGRVLEIGTVYVVGIGQICSPLPTWGALDEYSADNIAQLRQLQRGEVECGAVIIRASSLLLLFLMLATSALNL